MRENHVIVGGEERVVGGVEVQELVSSLAEVQEQRGAMQGNGDCECTVWVGKARVTDDVGVVAGSGVMAKAHAVGGRVGAITE